MVDSRSSLFCVLSLVLLLRQADATPSPPHGDMIQDWGQIAPSAELNWVPCFSNFTCTRLKVPLDYGDASAGTAALALLRVSAAQQPAANIIFNQGGPGGSSVDVLIANAEEAQIAIGTSYNIIALDPRGVGHSEPSIEMFPDDPATAASFESSFYRTVPDASSTALVNQYYSTEAFGKWFTRVLGGPNGTARYVSTSAAAQDMLTYVEAEQRAAKKPEADGKLWYYGISYGTITGSVFAAKWPDRVGRIVLDGVDDPEGYFTGDWTKNLVDADAVVRSFSESCHRARSKSCSFYRKTPADITKALDGVIEKIKWKPVPVFNESIANAPQLATYADLKRFLLQSLYRPLNFFPILDQVLTALEQGNGSPLLAAAAAVGQLSLTSGCGKGFEWASMSSATAVQCVDSHGKGNLTLEQYKKVNNETMGVSGYAGDAWSWNAIICKNVEVKPPRSATFGDLLPPSAKLDFPMLLLSTKFDPVCPLRNAQKMAKCFPGSVVVTINAAGHSSFAAPSTCVMKHVAEYLGGKMPKKDIMCEADLQPFES
ncbi:alpha/beta-hydrolase [Lophium mytilinum]|uniref:Alpha/beta-hydrolase n=1 Tax=Lophium mytilinum TaxID=390894 RepID=A0A6A6RCH0_9PEZI|nr:alpha/beta-hydrolase [Lophium mytilinum]